MQPQQFVSERSKVAFLISLLTGRALLWARAIWNSQSSIINSFDAFSAHFREVFGLSTSSLSIADQLIRLRQGTSSVSVYTLQFRTLAASCGWNETALLITCRRVLDPQIRAKMAIYDDNVGLESFMQKAVNISQRLTACLLDETVHSQASPAACPPVPEPMQLDSNRLTRTERARHLATGLCLYCGASGHFIQKCPSRPPRPAVSTLQVEPDSSILPLLTVQLLTPHHSISVSALLDSGSSGNFISQNLLRRLDLPRKRQAQELKIETVQGKPLGRGRIKYRSPPIILQVGCFHRETVSFLVLEGPTVDVILGRPWLSQHSPIVRWESSEILQWSESCFQNSLSNVPVPPVCHSSLQVNSTVVESHEPLEQHSIPSDYPAFQNVFSKQTATQLPPHQPWDCVIDLLPGATLPKGRVLPLSIPERKAMEDYIQEALQQRFIRPSTSPATSSFFFVGKKDGGLRPCIDYRTLNAHTVKLPYPLPLVPAALEELHGARIFSKLDLRSVYNLVRIREGDEWKTGFITPSGHYEYQVMPYGLSNSPSVFQGFMKLSQVKSSLLYCQFFHMYSTYIQRIEIALLSDPWCIQLTLNTDSRRSNTDKYSLTICTYKLYRYTNEDIVEKKIKKRLIKWHKAHGR